jgi:hypothetical protein
MAEETNAIIVPDRRGRFRSFMKRLNPTAPPKTAISEGLIYQEPRRSVFRKLAAGADLAIGSQQLIVGGIGSGKTTELLLAEGELSSHEHTASVYIDVSAETDLSVVSSGALLASFGLRVLKGVIPEAQWTSDVKSSYEAVKKAAYGYEEQVWMPDPEPDFDDYEPPDPEEQFDREPGYYHTVKVAGKLKPPFPPLRRDVNVLTNHVAKLTAFARTRKSELVAIFDGLDRLIKAEQFWSVAEQDLRAIRPLDISVLVAGPLSTLYGQGRQVKDYFDEVHYLPPAVADPKASTFLFEVLRVRGADDLMKPEYMQKLCLASGGVLRDLISLARNAGENAYLADADYISSEHINRAIEQLGNSYLLGLGTKQKTLLQRLLDGGAFSPSDPDSMELLITRRVLERSESRYEVHPALVSVFGLSGEPA